MGEGGSPPGGVGAGAEVGPAGFSVAIECALITHFAALSKIRSRCLPGGHWLEASGQRPAVSGSRQQESAWPGMPLLLPPCYLLGMTKRRILIAVGALATATVLGAALAMIGPRNVIGMLRYDTRREGELKVGDRAPDVELIGLFSPGDKTTGPAGLSAPTPIKLRDQLRGRPLVLVFGSFT